jgi:hypothetical protein
MVEGFKISFENYKINNRTKCTQGLVKWKEVVTRPKLSNNEVVAPDEEEEEYFQLKNNGKENASLQFLCKNSYAKTPHSYI